jgi:hypothetical protein
MTNSPISASTEQKPASPANPQQTQGNPQQGNQQQNQSGNKPSTDKPVGQPQQK